MEGLFDTDLIRILLGSIPHPAHLFPWTDIVHDPPPFPLEMAHCPLSELLYKDGCRECVVKMTKPAVHTKQRMVPIGEDAVCRHPASKPDIRGSFSPYLPALTYKYAVRHIFCVKCWVWKLRQVQGRMRCMGNLGAMVHVGTKRNSSAKELAFCSGVLLLFCVSILR